MYYFCEVNIHEKYLLRCIEIGKLGLGTTAPNPMVGCVIVFENTIIGEGFTSPYGGPHAEVNAIRSVQNPELLQKSTLYVTLEPCCHFGKTPPCTNLIIESGIPKVVIGLMDPNPKVAGEGIRQLRAAGCEVISGILEPECRWHHRRFLAFQVQQRPYIILKWAQSKDGFIAPQAALRTNHPEPYWISGMLSRQLVHRWRSEESAILIGTETAILDNPRLDCRLWKGSNPIRIVLDRTLRIPTSHHILDGTVNTLVICSDMGNRKSTQHLTYVPLEFGVGFLRALTLKLYEFGILSLIVEGGAKILKEFITNDLWDEARVFEGNKQLFQGTPAPQIKGQIKKSIRLETDTLSIYSHD